MTTRLLLASGNHNKVREFQELLGSSYDVLPSPAPVEVQEYGSSCAANALIKAKGYYAALAKQKKLPDNCYIIADDSGIFVPILGSNVPGVYSARFSLCDLKEGLLFPRDEQPLADIDEQNNLRLLSLLEGKEGTERRAYFYASLALLDIDGSFLDLCEGVTFGKVSKELCTDYGWGYDHVFQADSGNHWGKVKPAVKHLESHRFKAARFLDLFVRSHL